MLEFLLGLGVGYLILLLVYWIVHAIALFKIFKKAGQSGWKAWIPFLSLYTQYKFSWKTVFFWAMMALSVVVGIIGEGASGFPAFISWVCTAALTVIGFIGQYKLAKAFGKGFFFALGLLIIPPLFEIILGFGSAQYIGDLQHYEI